MIYMRTELYKIQQTGGALLKPMVAVFPQDAWLEATEVDSIMYGENINVQFSFVPYNKDKKLAYFPGVNWLDLDTF